MAQARKRKARVELTDEERAKRQDERRAVARAKVEARQEKLKALKYKLESALRPRRSVLAMLTTCLLSGRTKEVEIDVDDALANQDPDVALASLWESRPQPPEFLREDEFKAPSEAELNAMIADWYKILGEDVPLKTCAACGVRDLEFKDGSAVKWPKDVPMEKLEAFRMPPEENRAFEKLSKTAQGMRHVCARRRADRVLATHQMGLQGVGRASRVCVRSKRRGEDVQGVLHKVERA